MDKLIEFRACTIGYETPIIRNLDCVIHKKAFVAVLGPTGIGKSTLLRLVGKTDRLHRQPQILAGQYLSTEDLNTGLVFQSLDQLLPWKTALGNLMLMQHSKHNDFKTQGKQAYKSRYEAALEEVGLNEHALKYPHMLSGGMRQRVAIARALINNPELLLMDEPFGSLDKLTRERLQKLLLRLHKKHEMTVLFITHDVDEAVKLSDKIILIGKDGLCTIFDKAAFQCHESLKEEIMMKMHDCML